MVERKSTRRLFYIIILRFKTLLVQRYYKDNIKVTQLDATGLLVYAYLGLRLGVLIPRQFRLLLSM